MKHLAGLLFLPFVIIGIAMFPSCSPTAEKPPQNDFFAPVDRVVHKKSGSDTLIVKNERTTMYAEDSLKDSLLVLYQQQNKRLGDMVQELNLLTKKNNAGISKDTEDIREFLANRNPISNEILLEKIKNQNKRLTDVVEQLKLLSQSQQNKSGDQNVPAGATVVPVKPAQVQQVPILITGANAVPLKQAPVQKVPASRSPNTSFNYGKAIGLYKSQQYAKAIDMFEKLLNQKIEPTLSDRYHFWLGVCYLNLNKSNQAINEFTRVLGYSHSEKAEETYFMIGQCYERTGATTSAKMTYEKMVRLYPQGNLKQVAEKKLALLK